MSLPSVGRIWIVFSWAMSDCHSKAALITIATPPLVTAARNVMMATTAASALPPIEPFGTIVASPLGCSRWAGLRRPSMAGSAAQYRQLWGERFEMTKTGERRIENNMTGFKLATSVGGVATGERGDRVPVRP
jgi:hypothetical protein